MYPTEYSAPAPFGFGQHPKFERSFRKHFKHFSFGKEISLSKLADLRHPEVFIIPRHRFLDVVDEWRDVIGMEKTIFPFSSTDFYVDLDKENSLFHEFGRSEPFSRLSNISQLGYLVPPRPEEWSDDVSVVYPIPQFHHPRWVHSLLTAILAEIILARNEFSQEERAPMVLTAGCHDIATPAGGDSIKRVDPKNLHEEKNFIWVLERYCLIKRWAEKFGFNSELAQSWVKGEGLFGRLLDVLDKISYTALDCYWVGLQRPGRIRSLCLKHPLIMDVWQDIRFTADREQFFFDKPGRLFRFLLLRAYEHQELLFNPYSRALDLFLKKLTLPLYKRGIITKEQLLTQSDEWLERTLNKYYPQEIKCYIEPDNLSWKKFATVQGRKDFCRKSKVEIDHLEHIEGFVTGLDWPVLKDGEIIPLRKTISQNKTRLLEEISASTVGYYVYYKVKKG